MSTSRTRIKKNPASIAARWTRYIAERSPPIALLFIGAAVALAPMALRTEFDPVLMALGMTGTFVLLAQMRLGDEIKDYRKDLELYPDRPLPRGLLSLSEARAGMRIALVIVLILSIIGARASGRLSGSAVLVLATVYVWLMWKEFFIGQSLSRKPMSYAFVHQLVVYPLYGWVGATYGWHFLMSAAYLGFLTYCFGASFFFEIARKLNPDAPKKMDTYLHHYGPQATMVFLATCCMVSIAGAYYSGDMGWVLPMQLALLAGLPLIHFRPTAFKAIEGLAMLNASFLMWIPSIKWMIRAWKGN